MMDAPPDMGPDEEYLDDPVLCMHCMEEVPWDANMCMHCKAPLNFIASTDPYQRIHAQGFILRTAAEKPRSWWTVIGIWVFALSTCGPVLAIALAQRRMSGFVNGIPPEVYAISAITLPWAVVAIRCTVNFFTWRATSRRG
jgi:hypothetical protein